MISIGHIVTAAFDCVKLEMLKYAGNKVNWTEPLMQELDAAGHIHYLYLADMLDTLGHNGVSELKHVYIPLTWTKNDELQNSTESQKISLVKSLLENLVNAHDDLFNHKYGKKICKLVIAKDYFRVLSKVRELKEIQAHVCLLHTLYAEVAPM